MDAIEGAMVVVGRISDLDFNDLSPATYFGGTLTHCLPAK
jgi:hypothetical protein